MAYTKYYDPAADNDPSTPVKAAAWNHLETGISDAAADADAAQTTANSAQTTANAAIPKAVVDAKGDLLVASAADTVARLAVGTNDQVLVAASGEATGVKWAAVPGQSGLVALSTVTAKGDLIAGTGSATVDNLAVGTDGQVLTADSAQTTGLKWATAASSGIPATIFDAAGDLIQGSAADTAARLALGSNDEVLSVNSGALDYRKVVNAMVDASAGIALSKLESAAWSTYTPALTAATTNPTLGSGAVQEGRYIQIGKLVIATANIIFGSSGTNKGVGAYAISLPVAARSISRQYSVGSGNITDSGVDNVLINPIVIDSTSTCGMVVEAGNVVADSIPWAWGANDRLNLSLYYEAA